MAAILREKDPVMRGRKPKPTKIKELHGNPGQRPLNKREPSPPGRLGELPIDLQPGAAEHYRYALACAPLGLLRRLDQRVLVAYANACAANSEAARLVAERGIMWKRRGQPEILNPALRAMNQTALVMVRTAAELGFTPSSRSRIVVSDVEIVEAANANPFDEFAEPSRSNRKDH